MTNSREPWTVRHNQQRGASILDADGTPIGMFREGHDAERCVDMVSKASERIAELEAKVEDLEDEIKDADTNFAKSHDA